MSGTKNGVRFAAGCEETRPGGFVSLAQRARSATEQIVHQVTLSEGVDQSRREKRGSIVERHIKKIRATRETCGTAPRRAEPAAGLRGDLVEARPPEQDRARRRYVNSAAVFQLLRPRAAARRRGARGARRLVQHPGII